LKDNDFVQYVASFDLVCLVETFIQEFKSTIFKDFVSFVRPSVGLGKLGRDSGGIVCLVRAVYLPYIKQLDCHGNGNFLSFILDHKLLGLPTDILLVCAYVPPETSRFYTVFNFDNGISMLEDYILDCFSLVGEIPVIVCGDLNGRTANILPECFQEDYLHDCTFISDSLEINRFSEDKVLNMYGKCLLNMCSSLGMCILNGVCHGDPQGCYTFISDFGNSVNDYFLMSNDLFNTLFSLCKLCVGEQIHSQHMPVELHVNRFKMPGSNSKHVRFEKETYEKFVWIETFSERFTNALNLNSFKEKMNIACEMINIDVNDALQLFNEAIKECAVDMKKVYFCSHGKQKSDWFDIECKEKRRNVRKLLKKFKKTLHASDRFEYCKTRREYKYLIDRKKKQYNEQLFSDLLAVVNNQKQFWSKIKNISKRSIGQANNITTEDWFEHFKNVLQADVTEDQVEDQDVEVEYNEVLDRPISREEILLAIKKLKRKKSAGPDGILGEFFKCSNEAIMPFLINLFNYLFENGIYPDSWSESIIQPLYKKGNINDTNNYRGISLSNIASKLYGSVINSRLQEWVDLNNITGECQAGFKKDYGTVDHIFTLLAIVQKQFLQNRKLYVAFIDFEKAFDSISRKLLWPILKKNGVNGKLYHCIRSMYNDVKARVRSGGKLTDIIYCTKGVKQGDVCSPILFALFINELALEILDHGKHGIALSPDIVQLFILLFADDIILLSETVVGLQNQLKVLESASSDLCLSVNMNKSNIVVFRKGGFLSAREKWFYKGQKLLVVNCYKYLGIYFSTKLSFSFACQDLTNRAKRAVLSILNTLFRFDKMTFNIFMKLFDTQIQPIAQYGAEIWGLMSATTTEKVHLFAMKRYLGVDRRTPNDLVYGEYGRYPIYINSYVRCIRYWLKLIRMENNRLPKKAYNMLYALDLKGKSTWVTNVRVCLCQYGYQYVWFNQGVACENSFIKCFKQRVVDCFWQGWNTHLQESDRYELYRTYKTNFNTEAYFSIDANRFVLYALVKFRLGVSCINVHAQRYANQSVPVRMCRLCQVNAEDEVHILLCCSYLSKTREDLIPHKYYRHPSKFRLALLLSNQNAKVLHNLAIFLYKALNLLKDL
jgi:hypothetical protein